MPRWSYYTIPPDQPSKESNIWSFKEQIPNKIKSNFSGNPRKMSNKRYSKMACVLLSEETYRTLVQSVKERAVSISALIRGLLETEFNEGAMEEKV